MVKMSMVREVASYFKVNIILRLNHILKLHHNRTSAHIITASLRSLYHCITISLRSLYHYVTASLHHCITVLPGERGGDHVGKASIR